MGRSPATGTSPNSSPDFVRACPFTVVIDTREQQPYTFTNLKSARGNHPITVPTVRLALPTGDYAVLGHGRFVVERKSKADLWGSIVKRENFEGRLARMVDQFDTSAIVVEDEISSIRRSPPPHTRYPVKSVLRTIQAWSIRYPTVHWWFMPGREVAEVWTFRLLEKFYEHQVSRMGGPRRRSTP